VAISPLSRFCAYGFLKNQRYFEPFLFLALMAKGLSFFEIGLLVALRELTVNLIEIPSGAWADAYGRRRAMLFSFAAYIASFAIFGAASDKLLFALAMVAYGFGDAFRTGTHKAMIFEWLRSEGREADRAEVYGYTRSWSKRGSAVSGLIAAGMVLLANDLTWVFWAAIGPYLLNSLNLITYPAVVDGAVEPEQRSGVWTKTRETVNQAFGSKRLRTLLLESMGFEGLFHAVKDYLQPLLMALAVGLVVTGDLSEVQRTAVLIGPIYALLHLLSSAASRRAHRLSDAAGGDTAAARWLWLVQGAAFVAIVLGALTSSWPALVLGFLVVHVGQNLWRPLLVSRLDAQRGALSAATLLSVESQSRRLATMILAPALGAAVDLLRDEGELFRLLPLGVSGLALCLLFALWAARRGD
jgi:MFS family permease